MPWHGLIRAEIERDFRDLSQWELYNGFTGEFFERRRAEIIAEGIENCRIWHRLHKGYTAKQVRAWRAKNPDRAKAINRKAAKKRRDEIKKNPAKYAEYLAAERDRKNRKKQVERSTASPS
jgi:hypothetical protein